MAKDETKELLDLMLHPVRMRILIALAGGQGLTPLQMADQLNDVPQATLYRHISRLAQAGILQVVDERPVRGTLEKVYSLASSSGAHLGQEAMSQLSKEDHMRFFTAFVVTLLDDFSRYLNHCQKVDMAADGVGYQKLALYMTDEELASFAQAMNQILAPYTNSTDAAAQGRKKRVFSFTFMPEL